MQKLCFGWRLIGLSIVVMLGGCSSAGVGLANHPLDCAIGIKWDDCLPGTPGYENGGGKQTKAAEAEKMAAVERSRDAAIRAFCDAGYADPLIDPVRAKIELVRWAPEMAPPFEIAVNDTFVSEAERPSVARWATKRESCLVRGRELRAAQPTADSLQNAIQEQTRGFQLEADGKVGGLVTALYQQKLTYGEFAQRRYEIEREAAAAERRYRQANLVADRQQQIEVRRLEEASYQNRIANWAAYTQAVNARRPREVHLQASCISTQMGTMVQTNCR